MTKPHPWRKYPSPRWTHNVQLLRLWMPPQQDDDHHKSLVAFNEDLQRLLVKHFGRLSLPSYTGFYRADSNWDNIDKPDAVVNHPDRGFNSEGVDNEP